MTRKLRRLFYWITVSSVILSLSSCSLADPSWSGDVSYSPCEAWCAFGSPNFRCQTSSDWYPDCGRVPSVDSCCHPSEPPCLDHPLASWELVDIALANNPETKISWGQARSAYFVLGQAKAELYPSITWSETLNFIDSSGNRGGVSNSLQEGSNQSGGNGAGAVSGGGLTDYRLLVSDLTANYLLLDFGGRSAQIESAKQALFAANWMQNRSLQDVMIQVLQSYYAYLGSSAALEARYKDLENALESLKSAEAQHEAGLVTKADVLLALSTFVQTQLSIQELKGQALTDRSKLVNAMGLSADSCIDVVPLPEHLPVDEVKKDMCRLIDIAQLYRDDFAAAYANYQQKRADLIVARSEGLPTVNAMVDLQRYNLWNSITFSGHEYTTAISLNIPIFQGFYYYNRERQARADIEVACAELQQTLSNLMLEVVTSYYQFETAVETVKYSETYITYTQEAFDLTLGNFKMGVGTILDVLKAQADLSNARAQYVRARTQWVTSLANIAYATGTL